MLDPFKCIVVVIGNFKSSTALLTDFCYHYFALSPYGCRVLWWACLCIWLSVYPLAYLKNHDQNSTKFSVCVTCAHNSVLHWRQCNTLCTSGFVDDVMFSRRVHQVAALEEAKLPSTIACMFDCCVALFVWSWWPMDGDRWWPYEVWCSVLPAAACRWIPDWYFLLISDINLSSV